MKSKYSNGKVFYQQKKLILMQSNDKEKLSFFGNSIKANGSLLLAFKL
ncbi:MAG: hypothetical protein MUF42_11405 [Cytophagaceae bacterium]|nr:hypothetical protein [Cytophagaceae bacterium]